MLITPLPHVFTRFVALLSAQLWLITAHAHPTVVVRGEAQLDADVDAATPGEYLFVRGRLRDELAGPIASAKLQFAIEQSNQTRATLSKLADCGVRNPSFGPRLVDSIETNPEGQFCVQILRSAVATGPSLRIRYDGGVAYTPISKLIAMDDGRSGLIVDCSGLSHSASLDIPELSFLVSLRPTAPTGLRKSPPLTLQVSLRTFEQGPNHESELERIQVIVGTPTRINIPTAKLGKPGLADLLIAFDGNPEYKPCREYCRVERTTRVRLRALDWPEQVAASSRVSVTLVAESGVGRPPPGFVELVGFDGRSSLFPLRPDGTAVASALVPRTRVQDFITLSFQTIEPGWQAAPAMRLSARQVPQSRWQLAAWFVAAVLMVVWFNWSRRRAEPETSALETAPKLRPFAHVEVIESASDPHSDWFGTVVDAHEGNAISGATIEVRRPGFGRHDLVLTTNTNDQGGFHLSNAAVEGASNCRLELRAKGYAGVELALPPPGRIKVHLVSVRRAILDRLISWAKRRGQPFDLKPEPTPDWLAETARAKGYPEVEAWAKAVSVAAFGSLPPVSPDAAELAPPAVAARPPPEVKRRYPESNG